MYQIYHVFNARLKYIVRPYVKTRELFTHGSLPYQMQTKRAALHLTFDWESATSTGCLKCGSCVRVGTG